MLEHNYLAEDLQSLIMAFYEPRSPDTPRGTSLGSIDFNRLRSAAPSFYIRMNRGPAYPVTINHGVEATYHTASPSTFSEEHRFSSRNSFDNDVYHGLPSIRNSINSHEPGSSPENPIYLEGTQEAGKKNLRCSLTLH